VPPATPNLDDLARVLTQAIAALAEAVASLARHSCCRSDGVAAPARAPSTAAAPTPGPSVDEARLAEVAERVADAVYGLNNMLTVVAGHAELGLLAAEHEGSLSALKAIQLAASSAVATVHQLSDLVAELKGVDSHTETLEA
jgi:HEPN domain-containing protein